MHRSMVRSWLSSRTFLASVALWTVGLGAALAFDHQGAERRTEALAETWARSALAQDLTYRRWASMHGGVYVPVTDATPPNPYLEGRVEEQNLVTPSGRRLTLVNPAYMTRQVHEIAGPDAPPLAHITSLDPIRPENGPDAWERVALESFEEGATERMDVVVEDGERVLRTMIPLRTDASCLQCHEHQGYRVGDIRGGVANRVPLAPFVPIQSEHMRETAATFALIWLVGLGLIGGGSRSVTRYVRRVTDSERHLRESEALLTEAQQIGRMGHYVFDIGAGTWTGSPTLGDVLGLDVGPARTVEEWLGVIHPADRARMEWYLMEHVVGRGERFDREYRIVRPSDGAVRWVHGFGQLTLDESGSPVRMVGAIQDVTDGYEAARALEVSEEQLRSVTNSVPDILYRYRLAPDPGFEFVSPAAEAITGYTPEEHYADPQLGLKLVHPEDRHLLERLTAFDQAETEPVVVRWIRKDGTVVWTESRNWPVRDEEGRIVAVDGISRDVTARVQAEMERDALADQLAQSQRLEAVGRLAGGVAHDFNNMLGIILGQADLALETGVADPDVRQRLEAIQSAGRRSANLTRQLLAFSRQQAAQPRAVDLNDALGGMLALLGRIIGENVELIWEPGPDLRPVLVDPTQIDQVVANLVVNARDAIEGAGTIRLATDNVTLDEVFCAAHESCDPGAYVRLEVSDTGSGMDDATLSRIFEPFFTTKEMGRGSGLGLATVYGIIRQNGGAIHVESEPGGGTCFALYLPAHEGHSDVEPEVPTPPPPPEAGSATVLVVEDEPGILNLTAEVLRRAGYEVLTAARPFDALRIGKERGHEISVLITDVVMPDMDGMSLAETLRGDYPDIAIVYMSGYSESVLAQRGLIPRGVLILDKPFGRADLLRRVEEALGG